MMVLLVLFAVPSRATQDPILLTKAYISWYANESVEQMVQFGIPASVTLAQAIFESRCGNSLLAKQSNNHFGIKCHNTWDGDTMVKTDDILNECFRKYFSVEESFTDHSLFLKSRPRYAHLFNLPATDYKGWCYGLKNAGYATYPTYAEELIKIIEENKLYLLDGYEKINLKKKTNTDKKLAKGNLSLEDFTVNDLAKCGVLFINEKNIDLKLLPLLIGSADASNAVAEK
ncbi:MAG: Mannosyl-glycoprotein endo-beta-N-acetylglucosamidase [Bacteroidetes bacterium]|nr:Mannosyl-glycoprotein endo-beta-N-acetylglucosamidase [Bacteroidota bacterium]